MTDEVKKAVINLLEAGKCVVIGEYRGGKAERINYTDKKSGKASHFQRVALAFEVGPPDSREQVKVTERLADDADVSQHKIPYKLGSRFVVVAESITVDKGNKTLASSSLIPVV